MKEKIENFIACFIVIFALMTLLSIFAFLILSLIF
jgi:hypothetical protein